MNLKIMRQLLSVFILITSLSSCGQENKSVSTVSPDQFEELMKANSSKIILDVRTPDEVKRGVIEGAMSIDFYSSSFKDQLKELDKDQPYFVYCAGGVRSNKAAQIMAEMGFKKVYDLQGGMGAWQSAGKPID